MFIFIFDQQHKRITDQQSLGDPAREVLFILKITPTNSENHGFRKSLA
jgi:hypothetical protein